MNEKSLIDQVFKLINSNYSNIYVLDIPKDKVYIFNFAPNLKITNTLSYTDFIDFISKLIHEDDLKKYFDALSLYKLEEEAFKGNQETKVKYRKLTDTGEYRYYVNIINYLPFENSKLIFMMSEDINDRLIDTEEHTLKLQNEVNEYKTRLNDESQSISDAIYQVNNLLENGTTTSNGINLANTREYINNIFSRVSQDHPELNKAMVNKIVSTNNYKKPSILIIDDSSIIRNTLKRIFEDEFNILIAKNGKEGIETIKDNLVNNSSSENIVGILLDLIMPVADGFEVLNYIKANKLFSRVPVAIISGDETKETRKKVYEYDIVDMLEKPFNTQNIKRRITKIINLYVSSNDLHTLVNIQNKTIEDTTNTQELANIIEQIVTNVMNSYTSLRLMKIVRIIAINLATKYHKYNLDSKNIDDIVKTCTLYNIGSIAMPSNMVITSDSILKEIQFGLTIINGYLTDVDELHIATNIIKYSMENYDGSGYPNGISSSEIPIEAQIVNLASKLINKNTFTSSLKNIDETSFRYNPDLIDVLEMSKKELKDIE